MGLMDYINGEEKRHWKYGSVYIVFDGAHVDTIFEMWILSNEGGKLEYCSSAPKCREYRRSCVLEDE